MSSEVLPPVSAWNIANGLTATRLALVPVCGWLLLHDGGQSPAWRIAAFVVFVVAAITDRFDGELARRRGLVTDLGKIADPIADKALVGTALIGLSILGELSWWITIVIAVRELSVTALRLVIVRRTVMAASRGGKLKTLLQAVAISLYLLPLSGIAQAVAVGVMSAATIATVVTGFDYFYRAWRGSRQAVERPTDRATAQSPTLGL